MSEPAFIALGDIHLKKLIWTDYPQICDDAEVAFVALVDMAIELHLPLVLVGDIFDSVKPPTYLWAVFRHQMDRCQEEMVPVYAIQGNHDKQTGTPFYVGLHDHVKHVGDGEMFYIGDLRCVGLDYSLRGKVEEFFAELSQADPKPDVMFLHQAAKQALRFEGASNCDLDQVPEGIPLIVMGDIHKEWSYTIRPGQVAYYTGASCAQEITQRGPKSCMCVYDDLTIERMPLPYREIGRFRVTAEHQVDEVTRWAEEMAKTSHSLTPAAELSFTPEAAGLAAKIVGDHSGIIWMENPVPSMDVLDLDLNEEEEENSTELISMEEALSRLVDAAEDPDLFSMVLSLADPKDTSPVDVVNHYREKIMESA